MRLLNVYTRQLEEFVGTNIPRYAILSHTWGEDEVLFQDLSLPGPERKKWSTKIEGCCQQAILDSLEFIWIDTCCIDKSSSAELSESINSMYAWYQRANVCYAYLVDVPSGQDPYEEDSAFRMSRWFTRGWTLQELLAPTKIVFFDHEWDLVFKESVVAERELEFEGKWSPRADIPTQRMYLLESITGIEIKYFENSWKLYSASAGLKFSWAAMRETSRPEDIAYCLLGLLNVNMPLLYGEGQNAFRRLQEEVLKKKQDLSVLAWGFGMTLQENLSLSDGFESLDGPLAPSIELFGNFPSSFDGLSHRKLEPTTHSMMTNLGLHISLPLICINSSLGIYFAFIRDWDAGNDGENREAFVLPLWKRKEGQTFEPLRGSPHVISISLAAGVAPRKIKSRMVYLAKPNRSSSTRGRRKINWINDLDSLFFHQYARDIEWIYIDVMNMTRAGFVVMSVFPPEFSCDSSSDFQYAWPIPCSDFKMIVVLSRDYKECFAFRLKARTTSRGHVRISEISMARCKPSFSACQFIKSSRWSDYPAMMERSSKLNWGSTVTFDSVSEEAPESASYKLKNLEYGHILINLNHHTHNQDISENTSTKSTNSPDPSWILWNMQENVSVSSTPVYACSTSTLKTWEDREQDLELCRGPYLDIRRVANQPASKLSTESLFSVSSLTIYRRCTV